MRKRVHTPEQLDASPSVETKSKADIAMETLWKPRQSKRRGKCGGRGRGRGAKPDDPRLHALDRMRLLDNSMRNGLGRRLAEWKLSHGRVWTLIELIKNHKLTLAILLLQFPFLGIWMDKAAQQFSAMHYLSTREKLLVVYFADPICHGLWNVE